MTDLPSEPSFFSELKRRRVVRASLAYAAAAFVVLQAAQLVLEPLGADPRLMRWLVLGAIIGFPAAVLLGWAFDLSPEGLRLTRSPGAGPGRLLLRVRPPMALGGAALAGVVAIGMLLATSVSAGRPAQEGTEMIAVLPFSVSGEGIGGLQDGMVELLSRNLDEVGGVRTADPRLIMRLWRGRGRDAEFSLDDAVELARETYATSFLSGSVVGTGRSVRITANLHSIDGARLATARVDGPSQSVLALVDSLSVALLRDVWRTSQPVPQLDVAAVTSGNLTALRSFLDGERFYRVSNWEEAAASYGQAVQADSAFALAHYKRSVAAGWLGDDRVATASAEAALRHVHRLPEREQTLVRAQHLRRTGQSAIAVDTLSLYLERYPDDAEAWFYLADDMYHLGSDRSEPVAADPADALYMFERALELDSAFVPGLIHPIEVSMAAGDTARAAHYLRLLAAAPQVDTVAVGVYRAGLTALRRPADADAAARALLAASRAPLGESASLMHQAQRATTGPLLARLALQPPAVRREVVRRLLDSDDDRATAWAIELLAAGGELAEARRQLERAARERKLPRATLRQLSMVPVIAGVADSTYFLSGPGLDPSSSVRAAGEALRAFDRREPARFRAAMSRLQEAAQDTLLQRSIPALQRGMEKALRGDAVGLVEAEEALTRLGFAGKSLTEGFWFRVLAAQAAHPETRDRALRRLERPWRGDALYEPRRVALLARA